MNSAETRTAQYNAAREDLDRACAAIENAPDNANVAELRAAFDTAEAEAERCKSNLEFAERMGSAVAPALPAGRMADGDLVELRSDQSFADHIQRKGGGSIEKLSLGKYLRGMALGKWDGAEAEQRALAEGAISSGGAMVPEFLAAELIDLARAESVVLRAGARTVPLDTEKTRYARLTGEPSGEWHAEGQPLNDEEFTFENVLFRSRTATVLVKASLEVVEDAVNLETVVAQSFAKILALKADYAGLIGAAASGTATPVGIMNTDNVLGASMSGPWTNYDPLVNAIGAIRGQNFEANAMIAAPRTLTSLSLLKDKDDNPLQVPADVAALMKLPTTQIPIDDPEGESDLSSAILGQFDQALWGVRSEIRFEIFREPLIEDLSMAFLAYVRMDFQLAHPEAFYVLDGIQPDETGGS